jgi:hypothetical protein
MDQTVVYAMTAAVALLAGLCAVFLSPARALGAVIMSMLLFPEYLRIPVGLAQMSAPRFAALVLLARMLSGSQRAMFRWRLMDTVIVAAWLWDVSANVVAGADQTQIVQVVGRALDTVLMYFVARLALPRAEDYRQLFVPLAVCAIALGALGLTEAIASYSPYQSLQGYRDVFYTKPLEYRMGLMRAYGSTGHPIYFGMTMFLVLGLLAALRGMAGPKWLWLAGVAGALGAIASSMSAGPFAAVALLGGFWAFYLRPALIKPAVIGCVLIAVALEILSNRHVYALIDYIGLSKTTSWYRGRLMEVAVEQLHEYWLLGVGGQWPHHWGRMIDGRDHVDVVNNYLIKALNSGVIGLGLYLTAIVLALRDCVRAWPGRPEPARILVFGQACVLLALCAASMSVGLFGPPLLLSSMLLGMCVRQPAPRMRRVHAATARAPVAAIAAVRQRPALEA